MKRREFLNSALATTLMGGATAKQAFAQDSFVDVTRTIPLHAYSRYLHWLRTPEAVAEACWEIACPQLMVTVQGGDSAHVQEDRLETDLPRFVNTLRAEGINCDAIRGGNQTAVDADVERLVGTMADLGITHYWLGTDRYDFSQPMMPQLDAIKRKVEGFVELNERYGTKILYHTRSGASSVGSVVWDLLYVFEGFDPQYVGLHWDTGHMSDHGAMWETLLRASGPYIGAVSWKDRAWSQDLGGLTDQGGPYVPAEESEGGGGGGRGGFGGFGGGGQEPTPQEMINELPAELAGEHFARGMGWSRSDVPMGTGVVDIFRYGQVLGEMGFDGMMDIQCEYPSPSLGGAERGRTELTLSRRLVLGTIKRDVLTVRSALGQSGGGFTV